MSIKIQKEIMLDVVSQEHDAVIRTQSEQCEVTYSVLSVNISAGKAYANAEVSVNGCMSTNPLSYTFTYDPDGGDVFVQAEKKMMSFVDISGGVVIY